jgi:hypothetical protein
MTSAADLSFSRLQLGDSIRWLAHEVSDFRRE